MDIAAPSALLGGLSPVAFMRRHWQKRPLFVPGACPRALPGFDRKRLFALAARDDVESRLVRSGAGGWRLRDGPLPRRALPAASAPGWSLLVQGVDLHDDAARSLLERFRFVPDARLDDVMISFAGDGGGVGPHVDSYDVFLLQVEGSRRWRIAPPGWYAPRDDVPLKMLAGFTAESEWLLGPGDMLYLPPGWAHEGVAVGACMTASIGFRAATAAALAAEVVERVAEAAGDDARPARYRDPRQVAVAEPARIPPALIAYADAAVARLLADAAVRQRALGEALSEPKPGTWFERDEPDESALEGPSGRRPLVLDRRTRMLYDDRFVFVNGEAFAVGGRDARLVRRLADTRRLEAADLRRLSEGAAQQLRQWRAAGWLHEGEGSASDEPSR